MSTTAYDDQFAPDPTNAQPSDLIAALRSQRQIDTHGIEVGVSRQAVDEAIAALELSASPDRDAIRDAIYESLGDAFDCTQVWEAWSYGTMTSNDFVLVCEQNDRLEEITDAVIAVITGAASGVKS